MNPKVMLTPEERQSGIVLIPVKPMVHKYLLAHFGEVVPLNKTTTCGQLMLALDIELGPMPVIETGERFVYHKFRFSQRHVRSQYNKHKAQVWGGNFCWTLFAQTMLTWVDAQVHAKIEAWYSLQAFLDSYAITEDEYPLESAYRYYQKYKPLRVEMPSKSLSA